jgi:predicted ATPase
VLVDRVRVQNFCSIHDSGDLDLGPCTVFIGANNSGKSALLRALLMGHQAGGWNADNVRHGQSAAHTWMTLSHPYPRVVMRMVDAGLAEVEQLTLHLEGADSVRSRLDWKIGESQVGAGTDIGLSANRPHHMFVPVLSRRRAGIFETVVDKDSAAIVGVDDRSLASRLQALAGNHAEGNRYRTVVDRVLGLSVSTFPVKGGVTPGIPLSTSAGIALERMGDGVRNIVTLASELVDDADERLFLIEEPENDLHPAALLALLDVVREAVGHHQFIVTTHSDVVLSELGSIPGSRVYETTTNPAEQHPPTTTYRALEDEFDRREALTSLGYAHDLPIGWLVFEESSAERFVRDCLIPCCVPRLAAMRTAAAGGTTNVTRTVLGLHRMVLFARLVDSDHPRAWVLVDGDQAGRDAVARLREDFSKWPPGRFENFANDDIESYYPEPFAERVAEIAELAKRDRRETQRLKKKLIEDVVDWSATEPDAATMLEATAGEVLVHLRRIETEIVALQRERRKSS